MNIFIYTDIEKKLQHYIQSEVGDVHTLFFRTLLNEAEQKTAFHESEVIMGNPPAKWFEIIPPKLVFWQLDSAGFDQYQILDIRIPVANMGSLFANACAETIVGGLLAILRGLNKLITSKQDKNWIRDKIRRESDLLGNKRILILGAGSIGIRIKTLLAGFGADIKVAARSNPNADFHSFEEIFNALENTNILINTLPGTAKNFVSGELLNKLPRGSLYASVGRGVTTDESALIQALEYGKLSGAVLDVTIEEPLKENNKLWNMENVILTQHTAGAHAGDVKEKVNLFLSNLQSIIEGKQPVNLVDLNKGY